MDDLLSALPKGLEWLGLEERRRVEDLSEPRQREFVAGRWLLRRLLVERGVISDDSHVTISVGGVPILHEYRGVHLSLSHRAGWVVAAMASGPVGVDVEVSRSRDFAALAGQICTDDERHRLSSLPESEAMMGLHEIWALKEAAFKAGLSPHAPVEFFRLGMIASNTSASSDILSWSWPDGRVVACTATNPGGSEVAAPWLGSISARRWNVERR